MWTCHAGPTGLELAPLQARVVVRVPTGGGKAGIVGRGF
ncbi:hypothetical protein THTE_4149 [Thermogutta terrifontis]|uniref:Uncharacterized protein n=1 Tax=Thermogutta terrifontis TaxID=1331910 RepID=A0A286RLB2_9BACT|nr:hypothetical protein THTE_4149 [Thermogutta terrifontis]